MGGPAQGNLRRLKYLHAFVDRHGRARFYFRRHGKRIALPGAPFSKEFMDAYGVCLSNVPSERAQRQGVVTGSFAALATLYLASQGYKALAPSSRQNYRRVIDSFLREHGHRRVDQFKREHLDIIIGAKSDTPGAGIVLLKRIRTLVRYALDLRWISNDPTLRARSYRSREFHTWTEDEITQFEAYWPEGSRERLAFSLLLYTGQRGSDVHRMARTDIAGDTIQVAQQKTRQAQVDEKLVIPIHGALRRELALAERKHIAILTTQFGKPFTVKGFGNFMSDAIRAARLPERCKAHGLRKAAARRLAEAGCTEKQIAAITGHKSLEEIARYTRMADQKHLARQAMATLDANIADTESGKPTTGKVANLVLKR